MHPLLALIAKIPLPVLLVASAAIAVSGDYFAKLWSLSPSKTDLFVYSTISYFIAALLFVPALLNKGLIWVSATWAVMAALGFILVGIFVFREQLTNFQVAGLIFGILSLILLNL